MEKPKEARINIMTNIVNDLKNKLQFFKLRKLYSRIVLVKPREPTEYRSAFLSKKYSYSHGKQVQASRVTVR